MWDARLAWVQYFDLKLSENSVTHAVVSAKVAHYTPALLARIAVRTEGFHVLILSRSGTNRGGRRRRNHRCHGWWLHTLMTHTTLLRIDAPYVRLERLGPDDGLANLQLGVSGCSISWPPDALYV